nr:MAG TPA: hypothetical protein [Caudoviricetes sp.]DAY52644.1 MAG TPA: hypothetical protein [Caudoviricetes sp.]
MHRSFTLSTVFICIFLHFLEFHLKKVLTN